MRTLLKTILLSLLLLGCFACAQPGRYQMTFIPASPTFEDRLVILDTVTGEGKVFANNYVRSFSYERETISELRKLQDESKSH